MPATMTCLRSLLLTILAVLALTSPSLAVGVAAASAGEASLIIAVADDGAPAPAFRPCARQGGKALLICQPDVGLPLVTAGRAPGAKTRVPATAVDLAMPQRAPKIEPPPPRRR